MNLTTILALIDTGVTATTVAANLTRDITALAAQVKGGLSATEQTKLEAALGVLQRSNDDLHNRIQNG